MMRLCLLILAMALSAGASAQTGLSIAKLFDGSYRDKENVVETVITGSALDSYKLDKYRSITVTGCPDEADIFEPLVRDDARRAVSREVINKSGRLYYGFYQLKSTSTGRNRYLLYLNQFPAGGKKIILLYLEGSATADRVRKMLKQ